MRKGLIYLLPAILAMLGVLWSCSEDETTKPEPVGLRIHEWGVLVGCIADTSYFMTSRPEMVSMVREPVIYIHSSDKDSVTLQAKFAAGKPTVTYPAAVVDDSTVTWENVGFDASKRLTPLDSTDHVSLDSIIDELSDVDADMLDYNGHITNFLFYEGVIPFENRVTVVFNGDSSEATLTNVGNYAVYDVHVATASHVSSAVTRLNPGLSDTVTLNQYSDFNHFTQQLTTYGFTQKEAEAFSLLWRRPFHFPDAYLPDDNDVNLVYRLSQEEYDQLIELTVTPTPDVVLRVLYILVHL
jgi:hypothetical protein